MLEEPGFCAGFFFSIYAIDAYDGDALKKSICGKITPKSIGE